MNCVTKKLVWGAVFLVGLAALCPRPALAETKLLRLWLKGSVPEAPSQEMDILSLLSGEKTRTLYQWLDTFKRATADPEIAGLALIIEHPQMSFAQIEEFTRAMKAFRDSGKKIYCYMDHAGNGSYALACATDHITLAEHSELGILGLNAAVSFYKTMFDKIGVQADMLHCGAFKSAVEPYIRTEPSKEAAENINWLLDGIFERWLQLMAEGRGLSVEQIRAAVDSAPIPADKALELKLVDDVSSFTAFKQRLYKEYGKDVEVLKKIKKEDELKIDFNNPFAIFELFGKIMEKADEPAKDGIGLIYIEGGIMVGKNEPSLLGGTSAGSTTIRAAFESARLDDNIKAVVVRVNSPGGSALASDIMWKAATRCAQEKPLIVSMGGVAGSGGYYVAIPGDVIFAEQATITGSIGVLGGKLVWSELWEDKIGITTTEFPRGKNAALMSMNRLWTDEQRQFMQGYLDSIYTQFKGRIMESRGERIKGDLEPLAGGRVYTGSQALEIGLIDRIGGLSDALKFTADKVKLGDDYELYVLPKQKDFFEVIMAELMGMDIEDEYEISMQTGLDQDPLLRALLPLVRQLAPEQAARVMRDMRNLMILNREHVGCFMPFIPEPR
ncbi:MAG: S49 family peptidase [Planctomycetota bacterium]